MRDLLRDFCLPVLLGGEAALGLPLEQAAFDALLDRPDAGVQAALRPGLEELHARCRATWARCPRPALTAAHAAAFGLIHDCLVGLHPINARGVATSGYLARLALRVEIRADTLPPAEPVDLCVRHAFAERALQAIRRDEEAELRWLGTARAYGRPLELTNLPWRVVDAEREVEHEAASQMPDELWSALTRVSPLTGLRHLADRGDPLPVMALEPAMAHRPLARAVLRALADAERGLESMARTLFQRAWTDRARLHRWLGAALYLDHLAPGGADADWQRLLMSLAPHRDTLGAAAIPPHEDRHPPSLRVDALLDRAGLR